MQPFNPLVPWHVGSCPLWHVPIPALKNMMGEHPSRIRGFGEEIAEIREMEPGDSTEWYSPIFSARMKKRMAVYHTREEEVVVSFILDVGPAIDFGFPSKREIAVKIMATLATLLFAEPNQGTLCCVSAGEKMTMMPEAGDSVIAAGCLRRLLEAAPHTLPECALLVRALKNSAVAIPEQLIIVFSDFLIPPEDETAWEALTVACRRVCAAGSEVVFFRILHALECGFPSAMVTVSGSQQNVWSGWGTDRILRQRQERIRDRLMDIQHDPRVSFSEFVWRGTEEPIMETLRLFLRARGRYIKTRLETLL